jgi:hypothetical protein
MSMNRAKPTTYSHEVADRLLGEIAEGRSLKSLCKEPWAPTGKSVFQWMRDDPEFASRYTTAKEEAAECFAEDMLEIADRDDLDPNDKRVRVDTRKWIAAKLKPKKYGDRQQIDVGAASTAAASPEDVANQLVTMATQYPTLNPVVRRLAKDILARLPELPG